MIESIFSKLLGWWSSAVLKKQIPSFLFQITAAFWSIFFPCARDANGNTVLLLACKIYSEKEVKLVLKLNSRIEDFNNEGCNALHILVDRQLLKGVEVLLKANKKLISSKTIEQKWTALHIASARGFYPIAKLLIQNGVDINALDAFKHTSLMIAASNRHSDIVDLLLQSNANISDSDGKGRTALHYSVISRQEYIVERLIQSAENQKCQIKEFLSKKDLTGYTPLHFACLDSSISIAKMLINAGADINVQSSDGSSPLAVCARKESVEIASFLISLGADLTLRSVFGCTVLHDSLHNKKWKLSKTILNSENVSTILELQDNDGITPLQYVCRSLVTLPTDATEEQCSEGMEVFKKILEFGVNVDGGDFSNVTPLQMVVVDPKHKCCIELVRLLLKKGADPTFEDETEFTALHFAFKNESEFSNEIREILTNHIKTNKPEFLLTFDETKTRNFTKREYLQKKRGAHNRIPEETRKDLLRGDHTVKGIASYINRTPNQKILVLLGAGASVNSGIPDFRSPNTGLYADRQKSSAFTGLFQDNPETFWDLVNEIFYPVVNGTRKPTYVHWFLNLLYKKGQLLRVYSQNVDMFERMIGLPDDLLIECHGTFAKAFCMNPDCGRILDENFKLETENSKLKFGPEMSKLWEDVSNKVSPKCSDCGCNIRPDVVFFGEGMPRSFFEKQSDDLSQCTCMIVIGTTLQVYPFAGLVSTCPLLSPRILINKEKTGPWKGRTDEDNDGVGYRDALWEGDCDEGIKELAKELGMLDELEELAKQQTCSTKKEEKEK